MAKSAYHKIIWLNAREYPGREIPLVLLADGRFGYVINQWIFYLLEEEITPSRLELYIRALCHLYDFAMARYPEGDLESGQAEALVAGFIDAKKYGTDWYCIKTQDENGPYSWMLRLGLYWRPLFKRTQTISLYLNAINEFDQWQQTFHGANELNPVEKHFLSAWEIYRDFKQRSKWDPFLHLHAARKHSTDLHQVSAYGKYLHRRFDQRSQRTGKAFPLDKFFQLIETTPNTRDKLLWLLMGAGSLRASETLHLFLDDVDGVNPQDGDARVILADPEDGLVQWTDQDGRSHKMTRAEYFRRYFTNDHFSRGHPLRNLQPRTRYGRRNSRLHAGFKGMTFGESHGVEQVLSHEYAGRHFDQYHVWWIDVRFGQLFHNIFLDYQQEYFWKNPHTGLSNPKGWPWHPWLFIATNRANYGMPLTMPALKQSWKRALQRLGMENSGLGMHSLRHMYGYYCANIPDPPLPLEMTQMLMHHANINSTSTYYRLDDSTIRKMISGAAGLDERITEGWQLFPTTGSE